MHSVLRSFVVAGATVAAFAVLAPASASAAPRNDVVLYQSDVPSTWLTPDEHRKLVTELGLLIAGKVLSPSNTLGANGFDVGFEVTTGLIHGQEPYWTKAVKDGSIPRVFAYPTLRVRKGLPFSLEGGMTVSYLPFTQQQVIGGQARMALHEGFSLVPDVAIQIGYDEYVGNEQLDLNVKTGIATLGYTWTFGHFAGVKTGRIAAWAGYGKLIISSRVNARGIQATQAQKDDFFDAADGDGIGDSSLEQTWDKWVGGVQVESGRFVFLLGGEFVDSAIPTINARWGASF